MQERLAEHIETVYLFGSVAQNDATSTSDVDLFIVVDTAANYSKIDDQLLEIAYDVGLEYGVRIEIHSMPADEFAERTDRNEPFVRTVISEGEAIA